MTSQDRERRPTPTVPTTLTPEQILELYRIQIAYLLAELERVGWSPYTEQP
jgi:hypothetical protein